MGSCGNHSEEDSPQGRNGKMEAEFLLTLRSQGFKPKLKQKHRDSRCSSLSGHFIGKVK